MSYGWPWWMDLRLGLAAAVAAGGEAAAGAALEPAQRDGAGESER